MDREFYEIVGRITVTIIAWILLFILVWSILDIINLISAISPNHIHNIPSSCGPLHRCEGQSEDILYPMCKTCRFENV